MGDGTSVDVESIMARHRRADNADTTGPMCIVDRVTWPCDAAALGSLLMEQSLMSAEPLWRGPCGHEWRLKAGWVNSPGPCPVCRVRKIASEMAIAALDL
jgi:hypothetical protein